MEQKLSGTILISESLGIENTNNFNTKDFNMKQQNMTAVEWFYNKISNIEVNFDDGNLIDKIFQKAKAMEKEQIKNAYWNGTTDMEKEDALLMAEDYFNEYYGKKN
jgi:hypothetical protein